MTDGGDPAGAAGAVILTVDRNRRNLELLADFLGREGYRTRPAATLAEVDAALVDPAAIDLALVDVSGFGPEVWARCSALHEHGVPHVVLSPRRGAGVEREGAARGARAVLLKPVVARELARLVRGLVREGS